MEPIYLHMIFSFLGFVGSVRVLVLLICLKLEDREGNNYKSFILALICSHVCIISCLNKLSFITELKMGLSKAIVFTPLYFNIL